MQTASTRFMTFILAPIFALVVCGSLAHAQSTDGATEPSTDEVTPTPAATPTPESTPEASLAPVDTTPPGADAVPEKEIEPSAAPVKNGKGLEESSLSNDNGQEDYKRPLLFAPEDNGLQPDNPQIKWDMDSSGTKINMGGLKLSSSQIFMKLDQSKRSSMPDELRSSGKGPASSLNLSFQWPTILTHEGTVSIENASTGVILWSQAVTEDMRNDWRKKLIKYRNSYLKLHQVSSWGITDLPSNAMQPFRQGSSAFRVCLSKQNSEIERLKVCSAPYSFQKLANGRTQIAVVKQSVDGTVFLKDKPIGKSGLVNAPLGKDLSIKVAFSDGPTIELASQPHALDLLDVVESKDGREIVLTGRNSQPLGKKRIVDKPSMSFWAPTGFVQDTIWQVALPIDAPTIRILGAFNVPFTFLFRFEKLPTEADRLFVREGSSNGTYVSEPVLFVYSKKTGRVQSEENSVTKVDDHHFEWRFAAPTQGDKNRARITLLGKDKDLTKWVAHHTLYHGYPFELSARLSGVLDSSSQIIFFGEVAASVWLETVGFQNELLSRNRWGLTGRYLRALTSFKSRQGETVSTFNAMNGDLKYNLSRGVWNRDQLFGVMGSLQRVEIANLSTNMAGVGGYWARTMPKLFSDLFDKFPLLDYTKYVDVEFIYYPLATSGTVTATNSFSLNLHGKVFWSQRLYGEAGFGYHLYGIQDTALNKVNNFGVAYGTVGMGLIF